MNVRNIMSTPAESCRPETNLASIAKQMWDRDCGFVPVVDASGRPVGVITDRDICMATSTRRHLPEQIPASEAMTSAVRTCRIDDSLDAVLATMKQYQIRRLPVVDAMGALQGVISLNDLVLASDTKDDPAARAIVSTLAAICAHRPVAVAAG